jgi:hypothetical protein
MLSVQTTSATVPVKLSWGSPPATPDATFEMIIPGAPGPVDMRTTSEYTLTDPDITYQIRIMVKAKECPPPSIPSDVQIIPGIVNSAHFPCMEVELLVKDRQGALLPFYNPFNLKLYEQNSQGEDVPMVFESFYQMDSTLWIRFCSDDDDPDKPERRIRIINDDDDPDKEKDTVDVFVPIPIPDGETEVTKTEWVLPRGWDLVSVPLDVNTTLGTSMFSPWPSTLVFWFEPWHLGYVNEDTMRFGRGYWVKAAGFTVGIYGTEKLTLELNSLNGDTEPIGYGWNLVGAPSKSLAVAMIDQNPPGSLMSIFGWDPLSGYVVPTSIDPGRGYWARVRKGAVLKMTGTSIQGGAYFEMPYARTQREINPAGWLEVTDANGDRRFMSVASVPLTDTQRDILEIPPVPAQGVFDIRTDDHTMYIEPGLNKLHIQGEKEAVLRLLHPGGSMICLVMNEDGDVLADLIDSDSHSFTWKPEMGSVLLLKYAAKAMMPEGFSLGTAYPNPASLSDGVTVPYAIDIERDVSLVIYDMLGREVRTLRTGVMQPGARYIQWNGLDNTGARVVPGVYLCRMTSEGRTETTTIVIAR